MHSFSARDDAILLQEFAKTLEFIPCLVHKTTLIKASKSGILTNHSLTCASCDLDIDPSPVYNFVEKYEYLLGVAECRDLYLTALARHIKHYNVVDKLLLKDWWTAEVASCFQSSSRRVRVAAWYGCGVILVARC
jgi:hypothetical protein